jgi:hypothetical protein
MASPHRNSLLVSSVVQGHQNAKMSLFGSGLSGLGIESTISQAVRVFELRATRYFGLAKTHLQSVVLAAAINVCRFVDYLAGAGLKSTEHQRSQSWRPGDFANRI